jgi:hypothetical protein
MNQHDPLDDRLTRALEAVPQVSIPEDFARHVLAHMPARPAPRATLPETLPARPSIGLRVCMAGLLVLFVAMLAISRRSGVSHLVEYACVAEFVLLTLWLSLRPQTS